MESEPARAAGSVRRSIEVEYWVIDREGYLTDAGELGTGCKGVEREFVAPLLEIKTRPCTTTAELRRNLFDRLQRVLSRADRRGKKLVPLATPVNEGCIADLDSERTAVQDRVLGEDFEYVRHCAGTHVHIEQQPGNEVNQLNTLTALDPALALVNSSPYYQGEALTPGARSALYRWLAYETLPNQGELWPYADGRVEYARRVERCYEEFLTEAMMAGVDRERVESAFTPEGAVWTPVQFRQEFSTVEWRSPDTALPSQVLQLAADIVSTVERALETEVRIGEDTGRVSAEAVALPTFDRVQEYVDGAVREGISPSVESYLERMGFDVAAYEPISPDIAGDEPVSQQTAREIRLEYASRLEEELEQERSVVAE
ncbi:MAG: glutamate-cysteine ligase family protein [Halovenus sp.]